MQEPYLGSRFLLAARRAQTVKELHAAAYALVKMVMPSTPWDNCSLDTLIAAMCGVGKPGSQMHDHFIAFEERACALRGGKPPAPTPAAPKPA